MKELVGLMRLVGRLGEVKRITLTPNGSPESDTTHTVMVAILAARWATELGWDPAAFFAWSMQYALVHDLVEAVCDDTPTLWRLNEQQQAEKDARERQALEHIRSVDPIVANWIECYEGQKDRAAQLVKVIDKACPRLTHMDHGMRVPRSQGMTIEDVTQRIRHQNQHLRDTCPLVPEPVFVWLEDLGEAAIQMMERGDA